MDPNTIEGSAFLDGDRKVPPEADYTAALKIVAALVDADPARGTPAGDSLEVLGVLVEAYEAQQVELEYLGLKAHLPGFRMLDNWQSALSALVGRSCEAIVEDGLLPSDFSDAGVHVQFEGGTDLRFKRAFYAGQTPADGAIHRVAVFSENCGYHEFWIGPNDRIQSLSSTAEMSDKNPQFLSDIRQGLAEAAQGQVVPYQFSTKL